MLTLLFETGHPWLTFKDAANVRSPQSHVGVVHSSNLCTEILLNTSADETAVCNLGSINLAAHIVAAGVSPVVEAGILPGKTQPEMAASGSDIPSYQTGAIPGSGRQEAALAGRPDACRFINTALLARTIRSAMRMLDNTCAHKRRRQWRSPRPT